MHGGYLWDLEIQAEMDRKRAADDIPEAEYEIVEETKALPEPQKLLGPQSEEPR